MRIKFRILAIAFVTTLIFAACEKDKNDDKIGEDEVVFTGETIEENKANIEQAGLDMVNAINDLEESEAIDVTISFVDFLSTSSLFDEGGGEVKKSGIMNTLNSVSELRDGGKLNDVLSSMRSVMEDPESIQEIYDMFIGVYDWNSNTEDWDITEGGDEVIFNFPSSETSTSNDATFRIYDYSGYTGASPIKDEMDYIGDLPEGIKFELKSGSDVVMSYSLNIAYDAEGYPYSLESELVIGAFVFSVSILNDEDIKGTIDYKITHDSDIIIQFKVEAEGDWTVENIENSIVETCDTGYVWEYDFVLDEWIETDMVEWIDCWDYFEGQEVIQKVEASFTLMSLKIRGTVNIQQFVNEIEELEDTYYNNDETENAVLVESINRNINLSLRYADNNKIIAIVEAYVAEDEEYEGEFYVDFRFIFGDESTVDSETYFSNGFENFINEINLFIDELNEEYGAELDHAEI